MSWVFSLSVSSLRIRCAEPFWKVLSFIRMKALHSFLFKLLIEPQKLLNWGLKNQPWLIFKLQELCKKQAVYPQSLKRFGEFSIKVLFCFFCFFLTEHWFECSYWVDSRACLLEIFRNKSRCFIRQTYEWAAKRYSYYCAVYVLLIFTRCSVYILLMLFVPCCEVWCSTQYV